MSIKSSHEDVIVTCHQYHDGVTEKNRHLSIKLFGCDLDL